MLSLLSVLRRSKNFTSNVAIRMPPSVPINHYLGVPKTNKIEPRSYSIIPCTEYSGEILACFKHSNLFKVNVSARRRHSVKSTAQQDWSRRPLSTRPDDRATRGRAARRERETRVRLPTIRPADVPVTNTPRRPTSATAAAPTGRVVPRRDRPRRVGPPGWSGTAQTQIRLRAF